jgi:hypothetical protein
MLDYTCDQMVGIGAASAYQKDAVPQYLTLQYLSLLIHVKDIVLQFWFCPCVWQISFFAF